MYCVNCGVKLHDSLKTCPVCETKIYHPELEKLPKEPTYPTKKINERVSKSGFLFIISMAFLLPLLIAITCDLSLNNIVTWSGYTTSSLILIYIIVILPVWFTNKNPVIFVPVDFAALALFLLFINLFTKGNWFLSFAFPITGALAIICTTLVVVFKYLRAGSLYAISGSYFALGALAVLIEFLIKITFNIGSVLSWSIYPLIACSLIGIILLVIAICRPIRESLSKKFFI